MSVFKTYTSEQFDAHFQQFLITSWSYSKVEHFARNQKSFEMTYVYGMKSKSGASAVAGNAYHDSLKAFFEGYKEDKILTIVDLEQVAYEYLNAFNTNFWKLQKTTPTVEDCYNKALKCVNALLKNFFGEIGTYIDEIEEIIDIEVYCNEWLSVSGFDVALPCHMKIDLVVKLKNGHIAIIDHKSKDKFSDEKELKLSIGKQAITYVLGYESKTGIDVDEVWFVENKISQNQDKSKQVNAFKVIMDKDTRRLYEHLLYEPLKAMLEAVSDADHVYILNESDNWVDKAELYEFWMKMLVQEVTDLDIAGANKEMVQKRQRKIRDASLASINPRLIRDFQKNASQFIQYDLSNTNMTPEEKIKHALQTFNIKVEVPFKFDGYSSNTYLLDISAGTKVASIHSHTLDIANMLDVRAVRLSRDLVLHENKSYLAVEFSKTRTEDLLFDPTELKGNKIPIGKDNFKRTLYWDLDNHSTTNILIGGSVGSGKSVCMRATLEYILQLKAYKIIILDPKYEFVEYKGINGIEVYNEIADIEKVVAKQVQIMNDLIKTKGKTKTLIMFDEFSDAMSASRTGNALKTYEMVEVGNYKDGSPKMQRQCVGEDKPLEENWRVLIQKGRSTGFRAMAGTQRASVKIIGGDTKVNFPVVICFKVPKEIDSNVMLDCGGAESLGGQGDGLLKSPDYPDMVRFQAFYKPVLESA